MLQNMNFQTEANWLSIVTASIRFFISNTFINNTRLKLAKNQAKAKQHPEAELLLIENFHLLHPCYHPKLI